MPQRLRFWGVVLGLGLVACSDGGKSSSSGDPLAPYPHGSDGSIGGSGGSGANDAGSSGQSDSGAEPDDGLTSEVPLGGFFRYGFNAGFPNSNWSDPDFAALGSERGCNSQRVSLPETHLAKWGWEIERSDLAKYDTLGLSGHVGFLTSPTREHSTAPSSAKDWELIHYIPKNLHEPILTDEGSINPENYWAKYVYETVKTYKDYIKIWEIWNEPDWVSDWKVTQDWATAAPTSEDLPRFNGSIYDYVRMLRVSKIAANLADPDAKIATGGIGYASFLGAILRYTDNPVDGSPTTKYPKTGAAYVDVISFHHYPIYTSGNSDAAVDGYLKQIEDLKRESIAGDASVVGWETTETGAPHGKVGDFPGGETYALNYLMKVMALGQARGIDGIDWFVLSDGETPDAATDPYDLMGLYEPVANLDSPEDAKPTKTGIAYATLSSILNGARYDADTTASLPLSDAVRGAAFRNREGHSVLVLWARDSDQDETASATASLPTAASYDVYDWDYSATGKKASIGAGEPLALIATPRLFVRTTP
jgi:hypothetical protein